MRLVKVPYASKVELKSGVKEKPDGTKKPWSITTQAVRFYTPDSIDDSDTFNINIPSTLPHDGNGQPFGYSEGIYIFDSDIHIERAGFDAPVISREIRLVPFTKDSYTLLMNRYKALCEPLLKN
jgi:hypothetical protein